MFEVFKNYPQLSVAFSEKQDGNMKLGDSPTETAKENRERFFAKVGVDPNSVIPAGLVQEDRVQVVTGEDRGTILPETDGSITQEKRTFLSVTAADCLPVFFYDPQKEVVAIAHAGWRGLFKGILPRVVSRMHEEFSSDPSDIRAAIGPGIGACHYEIGEEVAEHFCAFPDSVIKREGKLYLNLKKIAAMQLQQAGVLAEHLEVSPICTYEAEDKYFSWRRDKAHFENVRAMLAVIGLK